MNEGQLAVERDRLLEGGRTLEQVERMQRAAKPFDLDAVRDMAEAAFIAWRGGERNNDSTWAQVVVAVLYVGFDASILDSETRARFAYMLGPFNEPPRIAG